MNFDNYMLPCMNKSLLGIDCLGCGTQRALMLIVNGDFNKAFYVFPPIYTTMLLFGLLGLHIIDKSRNYHKIIIVIALINALIMIFAYFYKILNL